MPVTLDKIAHAKFTICADGPVIVSSKTSGELNPTNTDSQFLQGSNGKEDTYVIPGSTIKGVIRSFIESNANILDFRDYDCEKLFGRIGSPALKSRISFHDAYADIGSVHTTLRASTAIHPHTQAALNSSLNTVLAVDKGDFAAGFTLLNFNSKEIGAILYTLHMANTGFVRFGGRKSRGYGKVKIKDFRLVVTEGFNADLSEKITYMSESLDEAVKHFEGGESNG